MVFKDCINFANENKPSYITTIEGDQPRVRGLMMWFAEETGFYYYTGATKPFYSQLKKNPKVEACFYHPAEGGGTMIRVAGPIEFVDDKELKRKLVEERQFLKAWGFTAESEGLIIFRIPKGEAHFLTMKTNFDPKKVIKFG